MGAIDFALRFLVALLAIFAAAACVLPSADYLRNYDTHILGLVIASVTLLVFAFILISRKWQVAAAKGLMIVSWILAANFVVDLSELFVVGKADAAVFGEEQVSLNFSTLMFFFGAAITAMASVLMFMFSKDEFGVGIGNRVEKFKIPKF